jgi:hypothetical protein
MSSSKHQFHHLNRYPSLGTSPHLATPVVHAPAHDVIPDFIDVIPFSRTLRIGLRNVDYTRVAKSSLSRWWSVVSAAIPPCVGFGLAVCNTSTTMRLVPTQTHVLTLELAIDSGLVPINVTELPIDVVMSPCLDESPCNIVDEQRILRINVPIRHIPIWTPTSYTAIRATYNVGFNNSTIFLVPPSRLPNDEGEGGPKELIVALRNNFN